MEGRGWEGLNRAVMLQMRTNTGERARETSNNAAICITFLTPFKWGGVQLTQLGEEEVRWGGATATLRRRLSPELS